MARHPKNARRSTVEVRHYPLPDRRTQLGRNHIMDWERPALFAAMAGVPGAIWILSEGMADRWEAWLSGGIMVAGMACLGVVADLPEQDRRRRFATIGAVLLICLGIVFGNLSIP